ncbi:ABC transporter permease [Rickettsiales endosymbiont of Peranema trichophorum]|uniref:ABC transporter permease n=1 Tax=Rickettsiales endosymbiont of Peranema trichophorum TaxID=2486577 RepID=UPI00102362FF|nr:ABC transporter permease [Rickettsiales endosymbiont of Peranema trichophorum]RZI47343.1 ABC transporter permease [Rickettsiales endosymbiont of Peranema trichophorum]
MNLICRRTGWLIYKELLILLRDPKARIVLIVPPLLQLILFAFAATLEVKNASILIYNQDVGAHSREIINRLSATPVFTHLKFADSSTEFKAAIDLQEVIAAIHIPQDFSRKIEFDLTTNVQVILDGRRSNASQIVNGYINQIISRYANELSTNFNNKESQISIVERHFFNNNLIYMWFTVPSLIGVLSMLVALMVTALSVAREKELGTFDQLLVSPLMPYEVIIGKTVPAVLVGLAEGIAILLAAIHIFHIPFQGSIVLLIVALLIFVISIVGIGLLISSVSQTQQQAVVLAFVFMVPAVSLSGYATPIENMPHWLQVVMSINPLKYFLITVKGIFLKGMTFADVIHTTWPLLLIGFATLGLSTRLFIKRLEL